MLKVHERISAYITQILAGVTNIINYDNTTRGFDCFKNKTCSMSITAYNAGLRRYAHEVCLVKASHTFYSLKNIVWAQRFCLAGSSP